MDTATEKNPEARRPKAFDSKQGLLLVFKREKKQAAQAIDHAELSLQKTRQVLCGVGACPGKRPGRVVQPGRRAGV